VNPPKDSASVTFNCNVMVLPDWRFKLAMLEGFTATFARSGSLGDAWAGRGPSQTLENMTRKTRSTIPRLVFNKPF